MKKINNIWFLVVGFGLLVFSSCAKDFLEQENTTNLNQETFFDSDESVAAATATLYNYVWSSFNGKAYYGMGDGRANNITAQYSDYIYPYTNFTDGSLSQGLADAWNSLYSVVARSNEAIYNIEHYATSAVSQDAKAQAIAEARFMRGTAYWHIAMLWGGGIIYTVTSDLVNSYSSVKPNPAVDMVEFAIRDLEYAAETLPETPSATGRLSCYSAWGMLSRVYLTMAGLTTDGKYDTANHSNVATNFDRHKRNEYYLNLASMAALVVVAYAETSGKIGLMEDYGDLFSPELAKSNNNKETLFQLQWTTGSTDAIGWGCNQDIVAFYGWSTMVADGTNWGGATYCSWDLWKEFHKEGDDPVRRHYSIASDGEYYPYYNKANGGYTYGETETAGNQGANICKYVVGVNKDNGYSFKQSAGINTYMLRYSEVLLNLAEALLGNEEQTSGDVALEAFNQVRSRAGMPKKTSIGYEDLRHERRVEFAFEGRYWYDLVNRALYYQTDVVNYLNNQQRNASYGLSSSTYAGEECANYFLTKDYAAPGPSVNVATELKLILQVPDADQGKNPNLKPGTDGKMVTEYYTFE